MADALSTAKPILERFRLDGRTALVTGGGQGIGRAYAHALGEAGASVAVVDISIEYAETVAAELLEKGVEAMAVVADVTEPDQIQSCIDQIVDRWGSLTIGVNNAGIAGWFDSETMPKDE